MRYIKIVRTEREEWITIGELIEENQPYIFKKLKFRYPIITRIIMDEEKFRDIKYLMEERQGVMM